MTPVYVLLAGGRTMELFHFVFVSLDGLVGCQGMDSLSNGGKYVTCRLLNQTDV